MGDAHRRRALSIHGPCCQQCDSGVGPEPRDVIAFPKTAKGTCLMTESPSPVSPRQLRDLHIEVKAAKKE